MLVWKTSPKSNRFIVVPLYPKDIFPNKWTENGRWWTSPLSPIFFVKMLLWVKKKQMAAIPPLPSVLHLVDTRTVALPHTRQCNVIQWNARQCSVAKCTHGNSPSWTSFCYKRRLQNPQFMEGFFCQKNKNQKNPLGSMSPPELAYPRMATFWGSVFWTCLLRSLQSGLWDFLGRVKIYRP